MAVGISVLALHRKALQRVVGGGKHDGRRLPVPQAGLLDRSLGGGQRGWADGGEELGPRALQAHRVGGEEALASGLPLAAGGARVPLPGLPDAEAGPSPQNAKTQDCFL